METRLMETMRQKSEESMAVMRGQFSSAVLDEFEKSKIYYMIDDM